MDFENMGFILTIWNINVYKDNDINRLRAFYINYMDFISTKRIQCLLYLK